MWCYSGEGGEGGQDRRHRLPVRLELSRGRDTTSTLVAVCGGQKSPSDFSKRDFLLEGT